ncbi:hypothetical protein [Streptomyces syringium]|uniref:hypothetical protein n=1 Tax=Streptomyces syringium TaxID=76729 RepID=UPI003407C668
MTHDEPRASAAEQLATISATPDLTRPASVGERAAGVVTLAGLYVGLVVAMEHDLPRLAGICVYVAALALLFAWDGHHVGAARRRPHTRIETVARRAALYLLICPGLDLMFDQGPDTLTGHLVTAAIPTAAEAVYLVLRWRR